MYESSGSQFFRTTTGIQSGPDAFEESRFVMTLLTILGVMEILCSFRLVLEGKTGKEIPESSIFEFLEKFLANNFALYDAEDNTSGPLNRGGIADLPLLRTLLAIRQKSREPSFWEVMDSFVLVAYASLAVSRTLLQRLLACLNFTLDSEDLFCWYKRKHRDIFVANFNFTPSMDPWIFKCRPSQITCTRTRKFVHGNDSSV